MFSLAAAALIAGLQVDPVCVWNDRGTHRVTVPVSTLVDHYIDIPKATRDKLKQRIDRFQYDEMATIGKQGVGSDLWRYSGMTYMHFGTGKRVCGQVKTDHWVDGDIERGMVFCQDGHCLIVPTVCSNLARVERLEFLGGKKDTPPAESAGGSGGVTPPEESIALKTPLFRSSGDASGSVVQDSIEFPAVSYSLDFAPNLRQEETESLRQWPVPTFYEIWSRPLLPGESRFFDRVPRFFFAPQGSGTGFQIAPMIPPVEILFNPKPPGAPAVDLPPGSVDKQVAPVPEPTTVLLMVLGLLMIRWFTRSKQ